MILAHVAQLASFISFFPQDHVTLFSHHSGLLVVYSGDNYTIIFIENDVSTRNGGDAT